MSKFYSRWKKQLIRSKIVSGLSRFPAYFRDWYRYSHMEGAEPIRLNDTYPCLFDKTSRTGVDSHYFYQHVWAMESKQPGRTHSGPERFKLCKKEK
ncbi:hypothetical protein ACQ9LF_12605 [Anaerohalosphaeraceae bacterium U12dextr]